MKAVMLREFGTPLSVEEVDDPVIGTGSLNRPGFPGGSNL